MQVIGDLWEQYLKLIDQGMTDGYVPAPSLPSLHLPSTFIYTMPAPHTRTPNDTPKLTVMFFQ